MPATAAGRSRAPTHPSQESRMFGGWFTWLIFGAIALLLFLFLSGGLD